MLICVCNYLHHRKKKLLISDMDGTIIENETLNDIANFLGKGGSS